MKDILKIIKYIGLFLLLTTIISVDLEAQSSATPVDSVNDTKREEVQRYFGYELLLYRYLSLPYDSSINVNQSGNFVDIGLIFIVFFPLILLFIARKNALNWFLSSFYLFFTWLISTSNSFIFSPSKQKISSNLTEIDGYLNQVSFGQEPLAHLICYIYKFSLAIYKPFLNIGQMISGNSDYVTYPLLFSVFILISLKLLAYFSKLNHEHKYFLSLLWLYTFFWLAFSGGIIWYGNILILMGLFSLVIFAKSIDKNANERNFYLKKSLVVFCSLWIILGSAIRLSDIKPFQTEKDLGKGIYNPIFYEYATGKINKSESLGIIYNDIDKAIAKINSENKSKVWRVGTTFSYFINKNNKRVIQDNQLGSFKVIRDSFG